MSTSGKRPGSWPSKMQAEHRRRTASCKWTQGCREARLSVASRRVRGAAPALTGEHKTTLAAAADVLCEDPYRMLD